MPDENMSLRIDPDTRDLVIGADGGIEQIYGDETSAQAVRLTLQTWKGEFLLDVAHGTDYDRILGKKLHELPADEINEVIREAVFQEPEVSHIDAINSAISGKTAETTLDATLYSGAGISMEVTA